MINLYWSNLNLERLAAEYFTVRRQCGHLAEPDEHVDIDRRQRVEPGFERV